MRIGRTIGQTPRLNSPSAAKTQSKSTLVDTDWYDAGELMEQKGLKLENHSLMRENLATFLAHRPNSSSMPTGRWQTKLERDLDNPYSNQQVLERIDQLQESLQDNLTALPSYPKTVFITGSFSKGRLGANSDLNGYAILPQEQFDSAFQNFQTRHQKGEGANLFPMSQSSPGFNKAMMMVEGTSVKISTEKLVQPGYLRDVYGELLSEEKSTRREVSTKLDGLTGKMWRSKFERDTFHFKAMRWSLHFGGTLSRIPLLGALLEKGASKIVAQNHRDLT